MEDIGAPHVTKERLVEMITRMERCPCSQCSDEAKELKDYYCKYFGPQDAKKPSSLANI